MVYLSRNSAVITLQFSVTRADRSLPRGGILDEDKESEINLRHGEETVPGTDGIASEPLSSFLESNQYGLAPLSLIKELHFTENIMGLWRPPSHPLRLQP